VKKVTSWSLVHPSILTDNTRDGIPLRKVEPIPKRKAAQVAAPKKNLMQTTPDKISLGVVIGLGAIPKAQTHINLSQKPRNLSTIVFAMSSSGTAGFHYACASSLLYLRRQPLHLASSCITSTISTSISERPLLP